MAQESWKSKQTERQPQEGPVSCTNNCGFFGSSTTMNLCSKCYNNLVLQQAKETSVKATVKKVSVTRSPSAAPASSKVGQASSTEFKDPSKLYIRCSSCKKRVGLAGIKCRCGNTFCSLHRYSDKHNCSYDYQSAGRDAIAKENPAIKAEKVENKI